MKPIRPMKLFVHSVATFGIIITTIHLSWYLFQQKYIPKDQHVEIPIVVMLRRLIKKDNSKKPDDIN